MEDSESPEAKTTDSDFSTDQFSNQSSPENPNNINISKNKPPVLDVVDNKKCDKQSPENDELTRIKTEKSPETEKTDEGIEKTDNSRKLGSVGSTVNDVTESSNCDNLSDRESIGCDDYSDDRSVDNNTFNIITENSESQEISELTNDDSSLPVAAPNSESTCDVSLNIMVPAVNVQGCQGASSTSEDEPVKVSEDEYDDDYIEGYYEEEVEDESDSYSGSENFCAEERIMVDPEEFIRGNVENTSKLKKCDPHIVSEKLVSVNNSDSTTKATNSHDSVNKDVKNQNKTKVKETSVEKSVASKNQVPKRVASPHLRRRIGSFGKNTSKSNTEDFKIEIFESKRPVQIPQDSEKNISDLSASNETQLISMADVKPNQSSNVHIFIKNESNNEAKHNDTAIIGNAQIAHEELTKLDSISQNMQKPEAPPSEGSIPDSSSSDKGICLDVTDIITEEGEDSQAGSSKKAAAPGNPNKVKIARPDSIHGLASITGK